MQFILGEEEDDGTHESHPLFSEMEELCFNQEAGETEWNETARLVARFTSLTCHYLSRRAPALSASQQTGISTPLIALAARLREFLRIDVIRIRNKICQLTSMGNKVVALLWNQESGLE